MTPERWENIQSLFLAVVDLDEAARAETLAHLCAHDPELRHDVEALVNAEKRAGSKSQPLITEAIGSAAHELMKTPVARAGERVGPYRLIRELGHGGMGAVYLAERADEEYTALVAIKFVRGALAAPDLERRFRTERQILANLTHANIAWLIDAGSTTDGTPYLVMEYVDGEPIDQWCERNALGLRDRIALFREVCRAVQYAHQALVVHRDLKPSNILVTADGTPKLVDFGIAKLLTPSVETDATATMRMLTPDYAAPEQLRGQHITVATDVYGLGAVLYRLLTGRPPFDLAKATVAEMERLVCEVDPARPSTHATGGTTTWARRLEGDLDTILLKALQKQPDRRYSSVEQLSDDLQRHVTGLPVRAQPDTLRYHAGKFVRRHRLSLSAVAGVLLLVSTLTAFYTTRLAGERDRATREAAKASEVSEFLVHLFEQSDPRTSRGRDVTARELLDIGAQRVEGLSSQPEVQATLLATIGRIYQTLGFYDQAAQAAEKALRMRRTLHGELHEDIAQSASDLGNALHHRGDDAQAQEQLREALRIRRALHPGDHANVVASLEGLASVLVRGEKLDEGESLYRQALAMEERLGSGEGRIASLSDGLASALVRKGDYAGAVPLFSRAVALVRKQSPIDTLTLATAINNLAGGLAELARSAEAEVMYREAYQIYKSFYGEAHPFVSVARIGLSRVLHDQGKLAEARSFALDALRFDSVRLGARHATIAIRLARLGSILSDQGRYPEAEPYYHRALSIRREALGPEHPYTAISINELANFYRVSGQSARAESGFREALALRRKIHPAGHPYLGFTLTGLGTVLLERGRAAEAEPLLREALRIREATVPAGHWYRSETESVLGGVLVNLGQVADGERLLLSGYEALAKSRGPAYPLTRQALERLINAYEKLNRPDDAARYRARRSENQSSPDRLDRHV